jgi:hypothetical protein
MANSQLGLKFDLFSLFGWFRTAPVNLTDQERTSLSQARTKSPHGAFGIGVQEYYQHSTTAQSDPKAHYAELAEMSGYEIVAPIIELYAEEATQPDQSNGRVVWIECDDSEVERMLNDMLLRIRIDDDAQSIMSGLAVHGNEIMRVLRTAEEGVTQLVWVPLPLVQRVYDVTSRRLIGFKWQGQDPSPGQGIRINEKEEIFPPWDFIHFRRMARRTLGADTEYGTSMIDHLFSLYRRIKMSVDQMVMYRMHVMPSRWVAWIDTGAQTVIEQSDTMNAYRNFLRASIGMNDKQFESRFNPVATDSILFFPKPTGDESKIDVMTGQSDVPDVPDLKTLFCMFFGGARVPKSYVGFGDDESSFANASLVTKDIRFARLIRALRKPFMAGIQRLCELQLVFKGRDPKRYKIRVMMSKISALEDEVRAATLERQANVASIIIDICQRLTVPNKEIIELVFREYLQLPRDFIDIAKLAASVEQAIGQPQQDGGMGGGMPMGGGGMPLGGSNLGGEDLGTNLGIEPETGPDAKPDVNIDGAKNEGYDRLKKQVLLEFKNTLVERREDDVVKRGVADLRNIVRDLGRIHASKKTSLVECFSGLDLSFPTEALPSADHVKNPQLLNESVKDAKVVVEEFKAENPSSNRPEVQWVTRRRQAEPE